MSSSLRGQNSVLDSLKRALEDVQNNSPEKADLLHRLSFETWDINIDDGLRWGQEAYDLSRAINYTKGLVQSLTDIGQYYYYTADYAAARQFYLQALDAAGTEHFGDYPAYTLVRLANLHRVQSSFDSAQHYFDMASKALNGQQDNKVSLSYFHFSQANLYVDLSAYDQAESSIRSALDVRLGLGDSVQIAECWSFLGGVKARRYELDSAEHYLKKSLRIAEEYNNNLLKLQYYYRSGDLAYRSGDYASSIELYDVAVEFMERANFRRAYPEILKGIGQIFRIQGDFNRALENYLSALEMSEQLNNELEVGRINNLIGWLYINEDDDSMAWEFGNRSFEKAVQLNDKAGIASGHNLIGYIHLNRKEFDKAIESLTKALELRQELDLDNEVTSTMFNLALVYRDEGRYRESIEFHKQIFQRDLSKVDRRLLVMGYNSIANVYLLLGEYTQAYQYLRKAEQSSLEMRLPMQLKDNKRLFAEFYKGQGDFRQASRYYEEYIALNDSIFRQDMLTRVAQLSAAYRLSRKEKEIRALSEANVLQQSQIEQKESQLRFQQNILLVSIVAVILLLLFLYVLYMYYQAKKKSHDELEQLNREVSEKNEEIQAQAEELMEANDSLVQLNNQLIESREEIQAQSEELIEANEIISSINSDLEKKVLERTAQLEKAYIELDTFFYRSSHDFRRPLTTFLGLAEVAKITVDNKNALELFDKVRETALNLDKMLVKLQSISDVGTQRLYYEEVDLKDLILNAAGSFRTELESKGIRIAFDLKSEQQLFTYPVLIKIIVENLVENSINFCSKSDPYISIRTFEGDHAVSIEIKDNGQGFAKEFSEKIFDMYFRANYLSKGNGLGLYIVKKAVDKLNGSIDFTSVLHEGSVFTVSIPFQTDGSNKAT